MSDELEAWIAPAARNTWKKTWRSIVLQDPCAYCGEQPSAEVDHIIPILTRGAADNWTNQTGSCRRCNRRKKSRSLLDVLTGQPVGHNPENRVRGIHYDKSYVPA